jgi:hypothetical protein
MLYTLNRLQTAIVAARRRTGDPHVGAQVSKGCVDVVRAVPPASGRGQYAVKVICGGLSPDAAVSFLDTYNKG